MLFVQNSIIIKVSLETIRSKLVLRAEFVVSDVIGTYKQSKRIAYQANKTFKDNCVLAARVLVAEHSIACQKWQTNLLECEDLAFFSSHDCLQAIEF